MPSLKRPTPVKGPVVRFLSLAVPPWVHLFCGAPSLERVGRSATHQDALRSTLRTSDDRYPYPEISSYELETRMAVPLCELDRWSLRRFAVSSARSLTLLFALVMASIARRRSMSMRRAGGAIYRTVVNGDQGISRAHRTHSSNLAKEVRALWLSSSGRLLSLAAHCTLELRGVVHRAVPPHRVENPAELAGQGHDGDALAAPAGDALRPLP